MKNSVHVTTMIPSPTDAEFEIIRVDYQNRGEDFAFVIMPNTKIGYFIEPWSNECLTGSKISPGQPEPVSLDQSDAEITNQEETIREWIRREAHQLVLNDATKRAPTGWTLTSHIYDGDWPETEFGASVLIFAIN